MGVVEDLGDELAVETLKAMDELDNDRFYNDVSRVVGASSPTLQEAFLTSIRIRLAALRGKKFVEATLKARREGGTGPAAPRDTSAH
ncbi:MAG: hypothetical protein U1E48_14235 [Paracoccaceae bacterium]